jgi:hypothetical protein
VRPIRGAITEIRFTDRNMHIMWLHSSLLSPPHHICFLLYEVSNPRHLEIIPRSWNFSFVKNDSELKVHKTKVKNVRWIANRCGHYQGLTRFISVAISWVEQSKDSVRAVWGVSKWSREARSQEIAVWSL